MTTFRKFAVFVLILLVVLAVVHLCGGEHSALARNFVRNLFRHLF